MAKEARLYDPSNKSDVARFRRSLNLFLKMSTERERQTVDAVVRCLRGRADATVTRTRKGVSMLVSVKRAVAGQPTAVDLVLGRGMR